MLMTNEHTMQTMTRNVENDVVVVEVDAGRCWLLKSLTMMMGGRQPRRCFFIQEEGVLRITRKFSQVEVILTERKPSTDM